MILRIVAIIIVLSVGCSCFTSISASSTKKLLTTRQFDRAIFSFEAAALGDLAFLHLLQHGIRLGVRQLKRILFRRGLTRRNNNSNVLDILHAIETEVKGIGGIIGYRTMHQRLVNHHNLVKNQFATF